MRLAVCVLVALVALARADDNSTNPDPNPYPLPDGLPGLGDMFGQVQMQQAAMHHYASVLLEWQSASAWSSAVGMRQKLMDNGGDNNAASLEEDSARDLEMVGLGGMGNNAYGSFGNGYGSFGNNAAQAPAEEDATDIELKSEQIMWFAMKLMWLEAAQQLNKAQAIHYQNKIQITVLQTAGAGNPYMSVALYLMYYRSILETLRSSFVIQRQDSWSFWLTYEIIETTEFNNEAGISATFVDTMNRAEESAMRTWFYETSVDVQTMFIDFYLNSVVSQMTGQGYGSFGPGFGSFGGVPGVPQQASFLEVEAEPAKPFTDPQQYTNYFMYYIHIMKFYMRWSHMQAAQGAYYGSLIGAGKVDVENAGEVVDNLHKQTISSWMQWANIRLMLSYYEIVSLFYGYPIPQAHANNNNAAFANLVQTDAPQTQPQPQAATPSVVG
jgi:hypothetical protein